MAKWNSGIYLKFDNERTQPAIDLAERITARRVESAVDLGCGPGNSTAVLKSRFPDARVTGIDTSESMIARARATYDDIEFAAADVRELRGDYDVIFSNACLQWVPDHEKLLPFLFDHVKPGGQLAIQIPKNWDSPLYRTLDSVVRQDKWGFDPEKVEYNAALEEGEYFDIISGLTDDFSIWETIYFHRMKSHRALVEWIQGTKLRPYLNLLDEERGRALMDEIEKIAADLYPVQKNGEIIYTFKRLFLIARK